MYQQGYNQSYDQYGSYGQYRSQYSGFDSRSGGTYVSPPPKPQGPAAPRVVLDEYNSDLNFVIEDDGVTGSSLHKDGFEFMWGGARATHGVRSGKVKTYQLQDIFSVVSRYPAAGQCFQNTRYPAV